MRTKNEIFDLIMGYLDMGIAMGFYTKEEVKEIENLEKEYQIQSDNQITGEVALGARARFRALKC